MTALAVEPSRFVLVSTPNTRRHTALKAFFDEVAEFTASMKRNRLAIAATADMYDAFWKCVADMGSLSDEQGVCQAVWRFYNEEFGNLFVFQGRADSMSIVPDAWVLIQENGITLDHPLLEESRAYYCWNGVLWLVLSGSLPNVIVKGTRVSVFSTDRVTLADAVNTSKCRTAHVIQNPEDVFEREPSLCRQKLAEHIANGFGQHEVLIQSTGNHPSIWDCRVRSIDDIPERLVRSLVRTLYHTGGVTDIRLGDFSHRSAACPVPRIELIQCRSALRGDTLHSRLYTKGTKGNCQDLFIDVVGGTGQLWLRAFPGGFDEQELSGLIQAVTNIRSGNAGN